jgi:hypothetical protein
MESTKIVFNRFSNKVKPRYEDSSDSASLEKRVKIFILQFESFINKNGVPRETYQVNYAVFGNIIRKVDRRLTQFEVFHEYDHGTPSELKEAALYAFWIVKLKPITPLYEIPDGCNIDVDYRRLPINESLARNIIFSAIRGALKSENPKNKYEFSNEVKSLFDYAFRFWDFSKESYILLVEALYYQMKNMKMI